MNLANNLMGAAAPIVTGYILGTINSFTDAFLVAAAILVVGIAFFIAVLQRIEPIADPDRSAD
jgi:ACS family D-galactonate transporter-like MFS transporter